MVKNLPADAGDTDLIPGPGRFPHASEQPSLCATLLSLSSRAHAPQQEKPRGEEPTHHN